MLQVREQEVLTGPQITHGGSRCVWAGAQLVDHLREGDNKFMTRVHAHKMCTTQKCHVVQRLMWTSCESCPFLDDFMED